MAEMNLDWPNTSFEEAFNVGEFDWAQLNDPAPWYWGNWEDSFPPQPFVPLADPFFAAAPSSVPAPMVAAATSFGGFGGAFSVDDQPATVNPVDLTISGPNVLPFASSPAPEFAAGPVSAPSPAPAPVPVPPACPPPTPSGVSAAGSVWGSAPATPSPPVSSTISGPAPVPVSSTTASPPPPPPYLIRLEFTHEGRPMNGRKSPKWFAAMTFHATDAGKLMEDGLYFSFDQARQTDSGVGVDELLGVQDGKAVFKRTITFSESLPDHITRVEVMVTGTKENAVRNFRLRELSLSSMVAAEVQKALPPRVDELGRELDRVGEVYHWDRDLNVRFNHLHHPENDNALGWWPWPKAAPRSTAAGV